MSRWQVNQARNHLSEVLDQADSDGPQLITHHGKSRAVVLSFEAYRSLEALEAQKLETQKPDFITFLLDGPKPGLDDFEIERDRSTDSHREIDL